MNYEELLREAGYILKVYGIYTIEAGDLVNETFIKYGELPTILFKKKMWSAAGVCKVNNYTKKEKNVTSDRVCKICKNVLASGWFRNWFVRGYLIHDSYCKPCRNNYTNEMKKKYRRIKNGAKNSRKTVSGFLFLMLPFFISFMI